MPWSTPDAPAEEVEACDYSHAGCADTEGQLHSLVIASTYFPILYHDISTHRLHVKITDASPYQLQHSTFFAILRKISQGRVANRTFELLNTDVCSPTEFQMVASMVSLLYTAPSNI